MCAKVKIHTRVSYWMLFSPFIVAAFVLVHTKLSYYYQAIPWIAHTQYKVKELHNCSDAARFCNQWLSLFPDFKTPDIHFSMLHGGGHSRYNLLPPSWTTKTKRYGSPEDGGKVLIPLDQFNKGATCIVYSLGSNKMVDFEVSILEETHCTVYTFDCT